MTTLDDVTAVAAELAPELPYSAGEIAVVATYLRPIVETRDELRSITRQIVKTARATGRAPGELALDLVRSASDEPADAAEAVIRGFIKAAYGTMVLAGALGKIDADVDGTQRKLLQAGFHALAGAVSHAATTGRLGSWRPGFLLLRGDLKVFEATLKPEDDPADEPPERRN